MPEDPEVPTGTESLSIFLALESGDIPSAQIVQEASQDSGGRMRIKVPFIIGNSKTRAPGFKDPLYFPNGIVADAVGKAQAQIDEGRQPLNVYGRHAHRLGSGHLPIGAIVAVEQQKVGRREVGFATLELEPTTEGQDAMILLRSKPPKLNAVSLHSPPGHYTFERKSVDGVPHLVAQSPFGVDGVDFAPDGPAMDTYGVQVLSQEATVEPLEIPQKEETHQMEPKELTLEFVQQNAAVVQEIERPLREQLASLTQERDGALAQVTTLTTENEKAARKATKDAYVAKIGAKMTDPQKALLQEFAATVDTQEEVALQIAEILLEAPAAQPEVNALQKLKEGFFPTGTRGAGAGVAIVQESSATREPSPSVIMTDDGDALPF